MFEIIKSEYNDIISLTKFRQPNYEVIDFEQFLMRRYLLKNVFIELETIKQIRLSLISEFGNEEKCFIEFGTLETFSHTNLNYYQKEVGLKENVTNDPIFVLNFKGINILWNGYHRVLYNIVKNNRPINGLKLSILR